MYFATSLVALSAFVLGASAHLEVLSPPPLRGGTNTFATNIDTNMVAPLLADGSNFPCKGYQSDIGTPAGSSTATLAAGSPQTFTLGGVAAAHNGGSCQVSLSYDNGKTFKVMKSFIGNCVRSIGGNTQDPNQTYDYTVPADAKAGPALWAWSWVNQTGNREFYMNCASVTIGGSGTSTLDDLPDMFVANVNNGCTTVEGVDTEFPNPGADVERNPANNAAPTGAATGTCGAAGSSAPPPPVTPPTSGGSGGTGTTASTGSSGGTHTVAAGDSCFTIGASAGVSSDQIISLNPSVNSDCTNLQAGQVITLRRRSRMMKF